jgi:Transposase DDE domain group 1
LLSLQRRITMSQSTTFQETLFSPHASLAAVAAQLKARGIFDLVRERVQIAQKTVKDSPQDKLIDILMTLLCGAQSLVQINTLLRADPALQRSIGRQRCCEQSVAQQTLDAATATNVEQMQQVLTTLFRQHSQAASHSFRHGNWLILDVDLTGMPCGKKAEKSVKGYFSQPRARRGRQQGRVLASQYGEIVVDELYPGNTILLSVLPSLIEKTEHVLQLTPWKRQHTILRIDAGGGTVESIRSLLDQGYVVVSKEYSAWRVNQLVKSVKEWVDDPERPDRQIGWVQEETLEYLHPVRRLAVRWKNRKGQWHYGVLLFAGLSQKDILTLMGESQRADEATIMRAYAHFYDQRGGGIETSFGEDKGGLGITKRNKKRFEAQRLLMLLGTLAHNLLIWARRWLCRSAPHVARRLEHYGMKRMVRDVLQISGVLTFDGKGRLCAITLQASSSLAQLILASLHHLLALSHIAVTLAQT